MAWEHQAVCPSTISTIAIDTELMQATITPAAPENAAQTDVCDIYRLTADGAYLIAEDVAFGSSIVDRFAPFSRDGENLAYRLCTRTADGDIDFTDVPYSLRSRALRIDFDDGSVTLPYNVGVSDTFTKSFESRAHMDGEIAGYWNANVARTASITTDFVRGDAELAELVRELAGYAGACFVRTPSGSAYEADVEVEGLDEAYNSVASAVSLNVTEVRLTDEFRATPPEWGEEPAPEP